MNAATKLPGDVGPIHFVGIGGIGMSGIAEVLLNHGYSIQGSDLKTTKITDRLVELGVQVFEGQRAENIENAAVIVISSAIKPGNPELDAARARGLPIVRADAPEIQHRSCWHPRQNHDDYDDGRTDGCR